VLCDGALCLLACGVALHADLRVVGLVYHFENLLEDVLAHDAVEELAGLEGFVVFFLE
jgi:hypothetical protein